jgi:hypothetical protein
LDKAKGSSAGPLGGVLRASWPGTRVIKSALASGLAWWAATQFGDPAPMFAVFGALNGMQPTVAASLRLTGGALVGIVGGSALAVLSETFVDAPRAVMVALLVGLGLLAALRLHMYALLGTEVAVTGLLVFVLSQGNVVWALGRLGETALGGGIAIVINALILPPDYHQEARRAAIVLAHELVLQVQTALDDVLHPPPAAEARAHLQDARAATRVAEDLMVQISRAAEALRFSPVLRYSPLRRGLAARIDRYITCVDVLASGLVHAYMASHAAFCLRGATPPVGDWDGLRAEIEPAMFRFVDYIVEGSASARAVADEALCRALEKHAEIVAASHVGDRPWDMHHATLLTAVEHVLEDLRLALSAATGE